MSDGTKVCTICGECKPLAGFHKRDATRLRTECRVCQNARQKKWQQNNRDRYLANARDAQRRWREANPERHRAQMARDAAKRRKGPTNHSIVCERCGDTFEYVRTYKDRTVCPPCRKVDNAWRMYGLTSKTLPAFYETHGNSCGICGATDAPNRWGQGLHIDHDHGSGGLRGLLCSPCNRGIGYFADDPTRLRAAAAYLERR